MGYKYNKENILNVGYDVFRRNGYHNVGINQILKESGIPKGSFYNFFESKEDFAQQVVKQYGETNRCWMKNYFEECLKFYYYIMAGLNEKDDYAGGCLVNNMSVEVGRQNDNIASEANEHFIAWLNVLADVIAKGQNENEITKEYTVLELAKIYSPCSQFVNFNMIVYKFK